MGAGTYNEPMRGYRQSAMIEMILKGPAICTKYPGRELNPYDYY